MFPADQQPVEAQAGRSGPEPGSTLAHTGSEGRSRAGLWRGNRRGLVAWGRLPWSRAARPGLDPVALCVGRGEGSGAEQPTAGAVLLQQLAVEMKPVESEG